MSSYCFECWNLDGHILANIDDREYIIDTGSPHTYLRYGSVSVGDRHIEGKPPPAGLMDALVRNVAPDIAGLVGLDVLSDYDVHIAIPRRSIVLHGNEYLLRGSLPLEVDSLSQGVPILKQLSANGRSLDAIFDVGARFSYLAIEEKDKDNNFGTAWDFWPANPAVEHFPVRLHNVLLGIAGRNFRVKAGDRADVRGLPDIEIVGSEVLQHFEINIALRRNRIEFLPIT